jgi:hypothetical protein
MATIEQMMHPIRSPVHIIPGMHVGCGAEYGSLANTLECFFDPTCLNGTARYISSLDPALWPKALNRSHLLKFSPNSTFGYMIDHRFVERLETTSDYKAYFDACAPIECTYSYSEYNSVVYMITLIIGLYGGLNMIFSILIPILVTRSILIRQFLQSKQKSNKCSSSDGHGKGESVDCYRKKTWSHSFLICDRSRTP